MSTRVGIKRKRSVVSKQATSTRSTAKKRSSVVKEVLAENSAEFCKNTTIHGLSYVTDKKLYPFERFYFCIAFVAVVAFSFYFAGQVIAKWNRTPVIFGFDPNPSYIGEEPFPAVTICNLNSVMKSKTENISISSVRYAMLQMLCEEYSNTTAGNSSDAWNGINDFIKEVSQPCERMLLYCEYGAVKYNCTDIFVPIMTEKGLCYSFNLVNPKYIFKHKRLSLRKRNPASNEDVPWSPESGYPDNLPEKFSPRTIAGSGESLGLRLILDVESHEYYCSALNSVGFKILLHNPMERPNIPELGLLLGPGHETKIRVRSHKSGSENTLRSLQPDRRLCYFENEFPLMFYQRYNQRNCEMECLTNMTIKNCGCVSRHSVEFLPNVSFCGLADLKCVYQVNIDAEVCSRQCLPNCYDMTYHPDFFSTPLRLNSFKVSNKLLNNFNRSYVKENIAIVHIYYNEHCFRGFKQTEFISGTDVLSSIGGLIGLFFGFSFISIAEFIFFALIRPLRVAREERKAEVHNQIIAVRRSEDQEKQTTKDYSAQQHYNYDFSQFEKSTLEQDIEAARLRLQHEFLKRHSITKRVPENY